MSQATLEHVNITVPDITETANLLCKLFDWKIRWEGDAIYEGKTIHVGSEFSYLALYQSINKLENIESTYESKLGLNHIAVVVDNLKETERRVVAAGFEPHSHADYEPGQRFYFKDHNNLEIEVVMYDK